MSTRAEWAQLGGLMFAARRLVEGLWAGRHLSTRFGAGFEFHDYRSYCPGDALSAVDWKLYGRTDRYFVRRHQQLTDLHVYLMLDCSASMDFAGLDRHGRALAAPAATTKWSYGAELAAAIAFLTIRQSDRVGVGLFCDKLTRHLPPGGTWAHLQQLCATLESPPGTTLGVPAPTPGTTARTPLASERRSRVGASLAQAHALMRRRGLIVLISDLLDEPAELFDGLSRFRHDRFEVIVFQVLTAQELDLRGLDRQNLRMVDAETDQRVPTDISAIQRGYADLMNKHLSIIRRGCEARGIDYNLLTTDQPAAGALRRYLEQRGHATVSE